MFRNGQWVLFSLTDRPEILVPAPLDEEQPIESQQLLVPVTPSEDFLAGITLSMHTAEDGRYVGIYRKAGIDGRTKRPMPACVVPVQKDLGTNVRFLWTATGQAEMLNFSPQSVVATPLLQREDIPAERLKTMSPDWQPKDLSR